MPTVSQLRRGSKKQMQQLPRKLADNHEQCLSRPEQHSDRLSSLLHPSKYGDRPGSGFELYQTGYMNDCG